MPECKPIQAKYSLIKLKASHTHTTFFAHFHFCRWKIDWRLMTGVGTRQKIGQKNSCDIIDGFATINSRSYKLNSLFLSRVDDNFKANMLIRLAQIIEINA